MCRRIPVLVAALVAVYLPAGLDAQVKASEAGLVSQTVDGTVITIEYSRPVARGRAPIFGPVVKWDQVWTPGANNSTTLEVSKDVTLDGHPVAAGKYSVWMIPGLESWEVVLDPDAGRYHTEKPEKTDDQVRFSVHPSEGSHMEALAWYFPEVSRTGATLRMHWGSTFVPIDVGVQASQSTTVAPDVAAAYEGTYQLTSERSGRTTEFEVWYEAHSLWGKWTFSEDQDPWKVLLLPVSKHVFNPGSISDEGQLRESMQSMFLEFDVDGDEAVGLDMRNAEDELTQRGERSGS